MTTFEIPASKLPGLQKKIQALQSKATKLGLLPVNLKVIEVIKKVANKIYSGGDRDLREALQRQYDSVRPLSIHYRVEVTGTAPVINGYQFLAKLENHGDSNIIYSAVDDFEVPAEFRSRHTCDHCKINRFRTVTYVLSDSKDNLLQVGSTCLKDFFRSEAYAEYLAACSEVIVTDISEEEEKIPREKRIFDLHTIVTLSCAAIRANGYVSTRVEDEGYESTRDIVLSHINRSPGDKEKALEIIEADQQRAHEVIKHVMSLRPDNNYISNLQTIISMDFVEHQHIGLVVSMPTTLLKHEQREAQKAFGAKSNHVGTVGKRIEFSDLTLIKTATYENAYGVQAFYTFADKDSNQIVWKTSYREQFETGCVISGKATIKEHCEFQGTKQTQVTRFSLHSIDFKE